VTAADDLARWGYVPTPAELGLIRAALGLAPLGPDAAGLVAAAAEGRADPAVARLLPLLRGSPAAAGLPPPLAAAVERGYHGALVRFVALERFLRELAGRLAAEGVPLLLLKGYPLARLCYASPAQRPMGDLDIALPPEQFGRAHDALAGLGLAPKPVGRRFAPGPGVHAVAYAAGPGHAAAPLEVDLHRHVLFCSLWEGADAAFWAGAVPIGVKGVPALTLRPEHHLLHVCLHGYRRWEGAGLLRWTVDAVAILRAAGDAFAWPALVAEARRHCCEGLVAAALAYLRAELAAPVPAGILADLAAAPPRPADERYFRAHGLGRPGRRTLARRVAEAWEEYARQRRGAGRAASPHGFAPWLAVRWGIADPAAFCRELARRLPPDGPPRPAG
jgi:hypothetical protein